MSTMKIATNDTNGIQSDKIYAIEIGSTIRDGKEGSWYITDPMPIISGPYDSVEDAAEMLQGDAEEFVVGSNLIDMIQTGNLHGVEIAFEI